MNHGSPFLDHRSAPVPPPPIPSYPGEPRQADPLTLPAFDPVAAPVPHRGKTCEPAYVANTAEFVAELRGTSVEALAEQTTRNFHELFSKTKETA